MLSKMRGGLGMGSIRVRGAYAPERHVRLVFEKAPRHAPRRQQVREPVRDATPSTHLNEASRAKTEMESELGELLDDNLRQEKEVAVCNEGLDVCNCDENEKCARSKG